LTFQVVSAKIDTSAVRYVLAVLCIGSGDFTVGASNKHLRRNPRKADFFNVYKVL